MYPELLERIYKLAAEADVEAGWGELDGMGSFGKNVSWFCEW